MKKITTLLIIFLMVAATLTATTISGTLKGKIIDDISKQPLAGILVAIRGGGIEINTLSNQKGDFEKSDVPVGSYNVEFSILGFKPIVKTDIIVKSKRVTYMAVEFSPTPILKEEVDVRPTYFTPAAEAPNNMVSFSSEEIRRSPGSAGDISRIISNLSSVVQVSDNDNGLAVRGGSPMENGFFIDNIEVPNINHYPAFGSTGGPIGLLNTELIKDVDFHAGGFSSTFGDKLSSVMEIRLREGNRDDMDTQLDVNMAGLGITSEGPLFKGNGSWLVSARKSFLDLLISAIGSGVAPNYSDLQGKVALDLDSRNKVTLMGLGGIDIMNMDYDSAVEQGNNYFGDFKSTEYTVGMNWFHLWKARGYSETSVSLTRTLYRMDWFETDTQRKVNQNNSAESALQLRNINTFIINHAHQIQLGVQYKQHMNRYQYWEADGIDLLGGELLEMKRDLKENAAKIGLFTQYSWTTNFNLTLKLGLRGDYFSYNKKFDLSPRFSLTYEISPRFSIYASSGIFRQALPLLAVIGNDLNKNLKNPAAYHYALGFNQLLSRDTRLTMDLYLKEYHQLPMSQEYPLFSIVDSMSPRSSETLTDTGRGRSYGMELTLQKKLKKNFYGLISLSYFRSRYRDLTGTWRNRTYDKRFIFTLVGGYKPNKNWEFSVRWTYAGGSPYTPYDPIQSSAINDGILDMTRFNAVRLDAYHSLNLRMDKRFHFKATNLIVFASLMNAYNRQNTSTIYWNTIDNKQDREYSWGLLPVVGVEYEF